ncbi:MAG: hypothetical protein ABI721_02770 [Candidatus Dojkabacteria bacterium]
MGPSIFSRKTTGTVKPEQVSVSEVISQNPAIELNKKTLQTIDATLKRILRIDYAGTIWELLLTDLQNSRHDAKDLLSGNKNIKFLSSDDSIRITARLENGTALNVLVNDLGTFSIILDNDKIKEGANLEITFMQEGETGEPIMTFSRKLEGNNSQKYRFDSLGIKEYRAIAEGTVNVNIPYVYRNSKFTAQPADIYLAPVSDNPLSMGKPAKQIGSVNIAELVDQSAYIGNKSLVVEFREEDSLYKIQTSGDDDIAIGLTLDIAEVEGLIDMLLIKYF